MVFVSRRTAGLLATLALAGAVAGTARAELFAVVPAPSDLPSHTRPNATGEISVPFELSTAPARADTRSYDQLLALWQSAGGAYGVPWEVLAAINKIESNFGSNMGPSSAGAVGWMQFMPSTWMRWGMDADGDGLANPWDPEDAVYSAARYLAAAGAHADLSRAIFAYNHAQWYVDDVLELARAFAQGRALDVTLPLAPSDAGDVFGLDLEQRLGEARRGVTRARQAVVGAERRVDKLEWAQLAAEQHAGNPKLTDREFRRLEARVTRLVLARERARLVVERRSGALAAAVARLDSSREEAAAVTFSTTSAPALDVPASSGGYVFPVGGGRQAVSVARGHHDYPAADIAAPEGSPAYAFTDAVVTDAFPSPSGRCGIGLTFRTAIGEEWVYCHLAYLEPEVVPGAALAAGAAVGLVGSTGNSSGPHLHLQLSPASRFPQEDGWFRSFAGAAFSWQGEPSAPAPRRVFEIVEAPVVTFTR